MSNKTWLGIFCVIGFGIATAACSGGGHSSTSKRDGGSTTKPKDMGGGGGNPDMTSDNGVVVCAAVDDPCGGLIDGTWVVGKDCYDNTVDGCSSYTEQLLETPKRIFSFVDGAYMFSTEGQFTSKLTFSQSCLSVTCAEADDPSTGLTCLASGSNCVCNSVQESTGTAEGTYDVSGATVTTAVPGADPESFPFCVKGDRLYLYLADGGHLALRRCSLAGC